MAFYMRSCGRPDIKIVPLYDALYTPQEGDVIVLEGSRRFFETQGFFDLLSKSEMPRREVQVGPISASTIYLFQPSALARKDGREPTIARAHIQTRAASQLLTTNINTARLHAAFPTWLLALRQKP
jgi:hypothetical protein